MCTFTCMAWHKRLIHELILNLEMWHNQCETECIRCNVEVCGVLGYRKHFMRMIYLNHNMHPPAPAHPPPPALPPNCPRHDHHHDIGMIFHYSRLEYTPTSWCKSTDLPN